MFFHVALLIALSTVWTYELMCNVEDSEVHLSSDILGAWWRNLRSWGESFHQALPQFLNSKQLQLEMPPNPWRKALSGHSPGEGKSILQVKSIWIS